MKHPIDRNPPFLWNELQKVFPSDYRDLCSKILAEGHKGLRLLLYFGKSRPTDRVDHALSLIKRLEAEQHSIVGIILEEDDPIQIYPEIQYKNIIPLPSILATKISSIKKNIENPEHNRIFASFLAQVRATSPDLGVVFFGYWVPPQLYSIPGRGFINYHPGPLPFFRGMEPDTFIILKGLNRAWGAVHFVSSSFDTGDILYRTRKIRVHSWDTPVSVLSRLCDAGVTLILKTVRLIYKGKHIPQKQLKGEGSTATLREARIHSCIDWFLDSNTILDRKLRAFCGQDIGVRLKAPFFDRYFVVYNLETHRIKIKARPGTILGYYCGHSTYLMQPIVKTRDGIAVLLMGDEIKRDTSLPETEYQKEWIIPPVKKQNVTSRQTIKRSISFFQNNNIFNR